MLLPQKFLTLRAVSLQSPAVYIITINVFLLVYDSLTFCPVKQILALTLDFPKSPDFMVTVCLVAFVL